MYMYYLLIEIRIPLKSLANDVYSYEHTLNKGFTQDRLMQDDVVEFNEWLLNDSMQVWHIDIHGL